MLNKFKGCLFGVAVGDALGAPVEGLSREKIAARFGWISDYIINPKKKRIALGQWTDDTALTMATAASLVEKQAVNLEDITEKMRFAFQFHENRGYGITTRKALSGDRRGKSGLRSSNGVAMRIAPIALYSSSNLDELRTNVELIGRITHQNQDSIDAALGVAFAIASAVRGELQPPRLIQRTIAFLGRTDMSAKLMEAEDILNFEPSKTTIEGLDYIGTQGNALETVGSAFYAFLRTPGNFRESVTHAVNAGGDCDTVASVTGAISGSYNGFEGIPKKWVNNVEMRTEIDELSHLLYQAAALR